MYGDLKIRHSTYSARYRREPSNLPEEVAQTNGRSFGIASPDVPQTVGTHGESMPPPSPAVGSCAFSASQPPSRWPAPRVSIQAQQRSPDVSPPGQGHSSSPCVSSCVWEPRGTFDVGQTPNGDQGAPSATPGSSTAHSCRASHIRRTITSALEKRVFEFYLDHAGPYVSNPGERPANLG